MKQIFTTLLCVLFACNLSSAQTVQIGTGTDVSAITLYSPIYRFSGTSTTAGSKSNSLFTQAELQAAGLPSGVTITGIEFNKASAANFLTPIDFVMYMANTSNTSLATTLTWASILTTHTLVYSNAAFNLPGTQGWVTWNITPFVYTGGAIEIATMATMNGSQSTSNIPWEYTAGLQTQAVGVAGTGTTLNGTTVGYKHRPNIRITYIGSPCTDPPTAGASTATPSNNVCPGSNVALNLTGNSSGSGQTYQWQSSPNNTTYTNVGSSSPSPGLTVNPTSSIWYRAAVTCGTTTTFSTPIQVNVLPGLAGNYTINSAVVTGGTNFQSFTDFASALSCGISGPVIANVVVGSGPYNEQVTFPQISGASNTITINGNNETLTYSSANTNERAGIKLNGADFFTINDLTITATGTYGYCIHLLSGSNKNTINNCTLNTSTTSTSTTNYAGIVASGSATSMTTVGNDCDSNTFSGNTIIGGYYGIKLMGNGTTDRFIANTVINNTVTEFYSYGIHLDGHDFALVQGNSVNRPTRTGITTYYGIYFTDVINGRINANRLHNPMGGAPTSTSAVYGIYFTTNDATATTANVVSNNAIYNINNQGLIYAIYNAGSDYAYYYHNTISLDETGSNSTAVTRAFYQLTLATGLEFLNNIVTISRGGTGAKHAIYLGTAGTALNSNRNILLITSTGGANGIGYANGVSYTTLADWQNAGYDIGSQSVDPLYVNMGGGDFTPQEPGINALGLPMGITNDILGNPRNMMTPDPGAFEFGLPPCITPPTAGDATATPASVCAGDLVALSLNNNSSGDGQTYQWQSSPNNTTYTNFGTSSTSTNSNDNPTNTIWYRAAVTCGTSTSYSTPVQVNVTQGINGVYTINSAVVTGGSNFQTFGDFAAALACGVNGPVVANVVAGSGPYNEQVTFGAINGTSATNTVTINGNGETLTYASTNTNERAGIKLNGSDYFRVNNLIVTATGTYGWGIQLLSGATNNLINACTVNVPLTSTSTFFIGILMNGSPVTYTAVSIDCDSNSFTNNTVNGGYAGLYIIGNTTINRSLGTVISGNNVHDFYFYGVYVDGQENVLVEGNDIGRPTRTGVTTTYCIYGTDCIGSRINANRIHNPMGAIQTSTSTVYGVYFTANDGTAVAPNVVSNNAIYDINNAGVIYGIYNSASDYAKYFHNTISLDNTASTSTSLTRAFYQITLATGLEFKDNIITVSRGGTGAKHGIYMATATTIMPSDHNDIYMSSTAGTNYVGYANANNYTTLADWQAVGYDANSVSDDPLYQNIGAGDLTPTNIAMDNLGDPVGITTDILGTGRSATDPDMGAWEFLTIPCADPTGLMAINITGSTADLSWDAINFIPGYEYVVDQNPGPPTGNGTFTNTNTYNATGLIQSTQYYLHVRIFCGNGNYSQWVTLPFETSCPSAIAVVSVTGPTTICQGDSVILSAQTNVNYTYQWKLNNVDIPGATDSNYAAVASGNYTVRVTNGVGCTTTSNPEVAITVNPAPPAVISGNLSICYSGNVTLSASTSTGVTYQWQENGVDIPGATTSTYSTNDSGSFTVRITYTSTGCAATSAPADVVINAPAVVSANDSFNCGPGSVVLTGVPSTGAMLTWYDVPGGTVLGTGNTFTTPFITNTTTYYVTAGMGNSIGTVGLVSPQSVGSASATNNTYYMIFDVLVPTTIVSVDIFTAAPVGSSASIQILDNLGNLITNIPYVTTISNNTVAQTIPLNVSLPPGTAYRMRQGTGISLMRNTTGGSYPYTSSAINITGNSFNNNAYFYNFYNWQFTTGCESVETAVVATIAPVPVATASTTDPTTMCTGDLVYMDATLGTGYTYQWLNNLNPINGADSSQYIVNATGNYSVIVTDGVCSDTSNNIMVQVNTPPASNIYPAGPTTICTGNSLTLNANTGTGLSYQWQLNGVDIAGATASSYSATTAGDYTVTVSNGTTTNCSLTSPIITVSVVPAPTATITPGGPTSVCAGESVALNANTGSGLTYQWQESGNNIPGAFTATYNATVSGTYTVLVSNGACAVPSAPVNVVVFPAFTVTATITGNVLSTGVFNGYQWYQNGALIPGANSQSFTALNYGDYYVVATDANGCQETSNNISYYPTGVATVTGGDAVSIYPNPASSRVFIKANVKVDVALTSVDGKLILQKEDAEFIDLGDIAPGVYQIKVTDKENRLLKVEKILKTER